MKIGRAANEVPINQFLGSAAYCDESKFGRRVAVPSAADDYGRIGDWAVEDGYAYFCVDDDTWQRVAIATWV